MIHSQSQETSVVVVGSAAYDSIATPMGNKTDLLGGSAIYFSISSSYFTQVGIVAVVGTDFLKKHITLLQTHGINTEGLEIKTGKSFRWSGVYNTEDINTRTTLETNLNVFSDFSPILNTEYRNSPFLFLANIDPDLQSNVLNQMKKRPKIVALDTMNFWISSKNQSLKRILEKIDVVLMDEGEIRDLSKETNLTKAAQHVMNLGPSTVVIKRGEHGVLLFHEKSIFSAPSLPVDQVIDPTGAGDSFAGGFIGYLAATKDLGFDGLKRATVLGSVMGSFAVESFGPDKISTITHVDIEKRFRILSDISYFEPLNEKGSLPISLSLGGPQNGKN